MALAHTAKITGGIMITDNEFLNEQTKEQIIIFLHNTEYELESLRKRMEKLTGCREFGALDNMNGNCIECFYDDRKRYEKCWNFKFDK